MKPALTEEHTRTPHRVLRPAGVVFGLALAISLVVYRQVWAHLGRVAPGSAYHTNDPMQAMWNLKWVAWHLTHGGDPFWTRYIDYPHGVSLTWNTLMPTLGIVAAPLTLTAGAAVSFTVLLVLAPALTALTAFAWLRRWTEHATAAGVGALAVGFSPYEVGHMLGHVNLTFTALLPVILMLLEDLLWRSPRPARRTAVWLGLVTAAQAGIDEELLLVLGIGAVLALAAAARGGRSTLLPAVRRAITPLGMAVGVFLLVASPLLVHQLLLSPHVPLRMSWWGASARDYLVPPGLQQWSPWHAHSRLGGAESGVDVGPLVAAVLVVGLALTVRQVAVRVAGLTLVGLVVLSMGTTGPFGVPLPWRAVADLPVFMSMLPARLSAASWLVIAWLLARWTDALAGRATAAGPTRSRVTAAVAAVAVVVGLVVTFAPRQIGASALPDVSYADSAALRQDVPRHAPVVVLPMAFWGDASSMYLQQQADFRFSQPGAYALRPDGHNPSYGPYDTPLARLAIDSGPYRPRPDDVAAARSELGGYRGVIVMLGLPTTPRMLRLSAQLTGRPADRCARGVCVWRLR